MSATNNGTAAAEVAKPLYHSTLGNGTFGVKVCTFRIAVSPSSC